MASGAGIAAIEAIQRSVGPQLSVFRLGFEMERHEFYRTIFNQFLSDDLIPSPIPMQHYTIEMRLLGSKQGP